MASVKDMIDNIPEPAEGDSRVEDLMQDPEYLRMSSQVIQEALKKGFDVLQLENGDIVTTGTKVIVTQYHWDEKKNDMVKLTNAQRKVLEKKKK